MYRLKVYREVLYHENDENDVKFEEELTFKFKIDMRNLTNFYPNTQKSKKFAL